MEAAIEFDITDTLDKFNKLHKDMPFLVSKSLNDVAFEKGRKALATHMEDKLEKKERWYFNPARIKVARSNKTNLSVSLFHVDESLGLQQRGGVELPKGKKLAIPIRRNLSAYAGVGRNKKIPKSLRVDTLMNKAPSKRGQTQYKTKGIKPFILKSGIFIRTSNGLRMLYAFKDKAVHTKKPLNFQKTTEEVYLKNFERYFKRNFLRVLRG